MNMEQIKLKIKEIMVSIRPDIDFENETNLIVDGLLESIDIVEIVMQIESEWNIVVAPSDLTEENFSSCNAIAELVKKLQPTSTHS